MKKLLLFVVFTALLSFAFFSASFLFSIPLCKTLALDQNNLDNIEHYFNEDLPASMENNFKPTNSDTVPSRNYTVLIDAGHGGTDPGSIGYKTKVHEDILNLKMSKLLKTKLESAGINVVMSRETDDALIEGSGKKWKRKGCSRARELFAGER